jgi:uncharacterized RDD family membrane protein YckC
VYCVQCGVKNELVESKFCYSCGAELIKHSTESDSTMITEVSKKNTQNANMEWRYAGFGARMVAAFFDGLLIAFFYEIIKLLFKSLYTGNSDVYSGLISLIEFITSWLYCTISESSEYQATPGKRALGIKVVGYDRKKISFARANARYFSKILSCIFFIGFLVAAFHRKNQALHDIIAKTYVMNTNDIPKAYRDKKNENTKFRGQSFNLK